MDKLFIHNLQVSVQVGVLPHEKTSSQRVALDLVLGLDTDQASKLDDLNYTVDYAMVRSSLIEFFSDKRFNLVETLANHCANFLFSKFPVHWLQLSVTKLSVFDDANSVAGVTIERARHY